jgi:hypothetical protein
LRPQQKSRPTRSERHIPAHVKRAVYARDGGRCTFVSESGQRCPSRDRLELDHVDPVARGGRATVDNIRLRCRGHNQFTAERAFGAEFMRRKRAEPVQARAAEAGSATPAPAEAVIPVLRRLGYKAHEAKAAAALCESMPDASLEARVRKALSFFVPGLIARGEAACRAGAS